MQKFEVGKKIWFIDSIQPTVKLLLVSEEIVKKTINGNTTEYVFETFYKGKQKSIPGSSLTGNFFQKREDAFKFMHSQAGDAINSMLDRASNDFPEKNDFETTPVEKISPIGKDDQEETMVVELPDGTKARVKGGFPI